MYILEKLSDIGEIYFPYVVVGILLANGTCGEKH
jgi:hypothetical protein